MTTGAVSLTDPEQVSTKAPGWPHETPSLPTKAQQKPGPLKQLGEQQQPVTTQPPGGPPDAEAHVQPGVHSHLPKPAQQKILAGKHWSTIKSRNRSLSFPSGMKRQTSLSTPEEIGKPGQPEPRHKPNLEPKPEPQKVDEPEDSEQMSKPSLHQHNVKT